VIEDILSIKKRFNGKLIVNDYIKFVEFTDGLHVGQEDLKQIASSSKSAIKTIREKIGDKILGVSTHNVEEIIEANSLNIDYIGIGAYRETKTKRDAKISGKIVLEYAKNSLHPVAIIGGVKLSDRFPPQISMKVIGSDILRKIKDKFE